NHGAPRGGGEMGGAELGHFPRAGRPVHTLVRTGRPVFRLLGDAPDAAGVASNGGRDGALVALVEGVLRGEAVPFQRAAGELPVERIARMRGDLCLDASGKLARRVRGGIPVGPPVGAERPDDAAGFVV